MRSAILAMLALGAATPLSATGLMDLGDVDRAVADFTGAAAGQPGGARLPVDRRLRLTRCAAALALQWYGRNRDSVEVRCPDAGWRVFVAVDRNGAGNRSNLPAEAAVRRGESVAIVVRGRGFSLSRQGEAMEDGATGEWVRVRPTGQRTEPVRAQVLRPGQVGMELP